MIKTSVENGVVRDERWKGFGRFRTTVDDIGVYKRCSVIRRVALCNRLSGKRGAGGLGRAGVGGSAWWGVMRLRRC